MKKTIEIGGKKVTFENSAVTPRIYKQQFGRDYFQDIAEAAAVMEPLAGGVGGLDALATMAGHTVNLDILENFAWACAATADRKTPDILEWLRQNPEFDRFTHGVEVMTMAFEGMAPKKK